MELKINVGALGSYIKQHNLADYLIMTEHPNLHLSPEERRYFGQLFSAADTDKIGVVTGEVAVKFFEKTRLPPTVLGEIWQIADTENRGLLTPPGFGMVLRLIGYAQAGRSVSFDLALQPGGPLPKFDGIAGPTTPSSPPGNLAGPLRPQTSGAGPIRVPPLTPDKVNQYSALFEESGAQNGNLSGDTAKQIFERAQLPNEILGRIWNLADTEQKGSLGLTEFIIAMHLLASYKNGSLRALPQILPAGLYEAAARRGVSRQNTGTRPSSDTVASAIPRQFSGANYQRPSSPLARPPQVGQQIAVSPTGDGWAISPQEKAQFDQIYATLDTGNRGFITGEQAVGFFSNSRLPEDALAQIWDLADINSEGQLNRDEFAVAMYLIKQQRSKRDGRDVLPQSLPQNLIPPSMRRQAPTPSHPTASAFDNAPNTVAPKKASDDLFGLDALSSPAGAPSTPPLASNPTGDSSSYTSAAPKALASQGSPQTSVFQQQSEPQQPQQSSVFKPFIPSSSFGQTMTKVRPQTTGQSTPRSQPSAMDDLLGDNDPEISKKLTSETTELANLSNQVGTLTGQMQQVQSKRISTEQELSQAQSQKRDFETRLAQLRGAYEQEIREVKALEEQLAASRSSLQKLQQEMAMIGGSHQDSQNQHLQIAEALAKDQQENAELKEKIRQTNEEVKMLKPQLEKLILDARQQKGLVAINKKQLATNEAEREKLKSNLNESRREYDEATKELEDSKRSLESHSANAYAAATAPAVVAPAAAVASPGGSSMNPFFRSRAPTGGSERGMGSPLAAQNAASPNHNAFDSFFGPPAVSEIPSTGPPPTSFGASTPTEPHGLAQEPMLTGQSFKSSEGPVIPTPTDSPPLSTIETPQTITGEPPAPPQSRQITSSFLPFRSGMQRSDSTSSSVKVVPPASRMGDRSGFDTPIDRETSFSEASDTGVAHRSFAGDTDTPIKHPPRSSSISAANSPSPLNKPNDTVQSSIEGDSPLQRVERSGPREIPGAFPTDSTPPPRGQLTLSDSSDEAFHPANTHPEMSNFASNDPFSVVGEKAGTPISTKKDFDDAFASFGTNEKAPKEKDGDSAFDRFDGPSAPKSQNEFPPIQEFGADDESDSDSDRGFDDDFTAASSSRKAQGKEGVQPIPVNNSSHQTIGEGKETGDSLQPSVSHLELGKNESAATRPPLTSNDTDTSQLPTPSAQQSPPTYDQVTSTPLASTGQRSNSTSFPAEYQGLLPSREDPTSPVTSPPLATTAGITSSTNGEKNTSMLGGSTTTEPRTFGQTFGSTLSHIQSPMAPGASEAPFAYSHTSSQSQAPAQAQPQAQQQPPAIPAKTAFDDFDDEFGDLSEAREADDKIDDELTDSRKENFDEFNPIFDSPSGSRSAQQQPSSSTNNADTSFHEFESSITGGKGYGPQQIINQGPQQQQSLLSNQPQSQAHDWDAIFAGLDTPQNNGVEPSPPANKQSFDDVPPKPAASQQQQQIYAPPPGPPPTSTGLGAPSTKPSLARAVSSGTDHDDPILKRLTGMGYPREESLRALEKFDYNIDKVM
ncbi:MAG: hypothetical protein HETSPECPRED_009268 [Heterodermia speciosa]|uniref:Uncharacterized protein n=1 Tax=Heterodermia speciosa TaxID=116794 RepID=A0A8H3G4R5_9LECA|nr:MAG: hypothetical protein HETSPECPRED_009268 [Heterodermia speciosa]